MLWAGADLTPCECSPTVLRLIFLRHADVRFDFVMANPPFNVSKIDKERLAFHHLVKPSVWVKSPAASP